MAVLTKQFGLEFVDLAEDVAAETFLAALETWPYKGLPDNPRAWLYAVAKNKALSAVTKKRKFDDGPSALDHIASEDNFDLSDENILDSQLQMMFAVCHPSIPPEAQIGLALRILCGFGIQEIADAFLTTVETINKRLYRAKQALRQYQLNLDEPDPTHLDMVLTTLYLLFSEGYYSESHPAILREELCAEAIRLTRILLQFPPAHEPRTQALLALMLLQSSRFPARRNQQGELVLYQDQDESLWDQLLISEGVQLLHQASNGTILSQYHIEASIAYWHTIKQDSAEKWSNILTLYDRLLEFGPNPVVQLNRGLALAKVAGNRVAIEFLEQLDLGQNLYFHVLMGELCSEMSSQESMRHYRHALALAKTSFDRNLILLKIRDQ